LTSSLTQNTARRPAAHLYGEWPNKRRPPLNSGHSQRSALAARAGLTPAPDACGRQRPDSWRSLAV